MKIYTLFFSLSLVQIFGAFVANAQNTLVAPITIGNMQTQFVTLAAKTSSNNSYNLSSNQIVTVTSVGGGALPVMTIAFNNIAMPVTLSGSSVYPLTFVGATNVSIVSTSSPWFVTLTILTPSTNAVSVVPVNSVVIPSDATGPVQIILESSSDLINWTSSLPGTYGNTYSNRFFRVRAVAQQ
jgi:hypothetical protein